MYRLLIVDDEEFVRNGLRNTFNWNAYGFNVVGTAQDGLHALDIIKKNFPHVVLTDIKMPDMDGLELIKQAKKLYPKIMFILLSAYDDFKYAQYAIKFDVKGYLVKPLDENEMAEILQKLSCELAKVEESNISDPFDTVPCGTENLIDKAKKYVNENYEKKISLEEMADFLFINPAYFSVVFKKVTGLNFTDYIARIRVEKAKLMLEKSRYLVKDIAIKVGYDDYTYFCKVFKKIENSTPLEYRSKIMLGK